MSQNTKEISLVNRQHKDKLFRIIFNDKKELLGLYNALSGKDYKSTEDLEIVTIDDAVFIGMKDDIAFIINDYVNLYEHQSTFNPNMPLRGLIYITDIYKGLIEDHSIYSSRLVKIPNLRYIVFYNGTQEKEDNVELKLSDAFVHKEEQSDIEVIAHMININYGHNEELMNKCKKLKEYAIFVHKIRKYINEKYTIEEAAKKAIDECIKENVLREILRKERERIMSSILSEFDIEKYEKVIHQDGYIEGVEDGIEKGIRALLEHYQKRGISKEEAIIEIADIYKISEGEANAYIEKYWE